MVTAYWQIGKRIMEEMQSGKDRAAYGRLFASKYMAFLPTEAELVAEIEREKGYLKTLMDLKNEKES